MFWNFLKICEWNLSLVETYFDNHLSPTSIIFHMHFCQPSLPYIIGYALSSSSNIMWKSIVVENPIIMFIKNLCSQAFEKFLSSWWHHNHFNYDIYFFVISSPSPLHDEQLPWKVQVFLFKDCEQNIKIRLRYIWLNQRVKTKKDFWNLKKKLSKTWLMSRTNNL